MKNIVNKLDKIIKSEDVNPALKQQAAKKREILINNKTVKK